MRHFEEEAFDSGSGWEPAQAAISGSTSMARAKSSVDHVPEGSMVTPAAALLIPELMADEMEQVQQLLSEFPTLFANDPKSEHERCSLYSSGNRHTGESQTQAHFSIMGGGNCQASR